MVSILIRVQQLPSNQRPFLLASALHLFPLLHPFKPCRRTKESWQRTRKAVCGATEWLTFREPPFPLNAYVGDAIFVSGMRYTWWLSLLLDATFLGLRSFVRSCGQHYWLRLPPQTVASKRGKALLLIRIRGDPMGRELIAVRS